MLERLADIRGALEEAEAAISDTEGMYGRESARAWMWAALSELEVMERENPFRTAMLDRQANDYDAARWPRAEGEMRNLPFTRLIELVGRPMRVKP